MFWKEKLNLGIMGMVGGGVFELVVRVKFGDYGVGGKLRGSWGGIFGVGDVWDGEKMEFVVGGIKEMEKLGRCEGGVKEEVMERYVVGYGIVEDMEEVERVGDEIVLVGVGNMRVVVRFGVIRGIGVLRGKGLLVGMKVGVVGMKGEVEDEVGGGMGGGED